MKLTLRTWLRILLTSFQAFISAIGLIFLIEAMLFYILGSFVSGSGALGIYIVFAWPFMFPLVGCLVFVIVWFLFYWWYRNE